MIELRNGDIIHKNGCKSLICTLEMQLKYAPNYEKPTIKAEIDQLNGFIEQMGDNDTMVYRKG